MSKQPSGHIVCVAMVQPCSVAASLDTVESSTQPTDWTVAVLSVPCVFTALFQSSCSRVTAIESEEPPSAPCAAAMAARGIWKAPDESSAAQVTTPAALATVMVTVSEPGSQLMGRAPSPKTIVLGI